MPDPRRPVGPARHERPAIDEAALAAARLADGLLAGARATGTAAGSRWAAYFAPIPDRLRDGDVRDLRSIALKARAAYGPKDSVRDAVPAGLTEPFLDAIDRLLRELARRALQE